MRQSWLFGTVRRLLLAPKPDWNQYHIMSVAADVGCRPIATTRARRLIRGPSVHDQGLVTMHRHHRSAPAQLHRVYRRSWDGLYRVYGPLDLSHIEVAAEHNGRLCSTASVGDVLPASPQDGLSATVGKFVGVRGWTVIVNDMQLRTVLDRCKLEVLGSPRLEVWRCIRCAFYHIVVAHCQDTCVPHEYIVKIRLPDPGRRRVLFSTAVPVRIKLGQNELHDPVSAPPWLITDLANAEDLAEAQRMHRLVPAHSYMHSKGYLSSHTAGVLYPSDWKGLLHTPSRHVAHQLGQCRILPPSVRRSQSNVVEG